MNGTNIKRHTIIETVSSGGLMVGFLDISWAPLLFFTACFCGKLVKELWTELNNLWKALKQLWFTKISRGLRLPPQSRTKLCFVVSLCFLAKIVYPCLFRSSAKNIMKTFVEAKDADRPDADRRPFGCFIALHIPVFDYRPSLTSGLFLDTAVVLVYPSNLTSLYKPSVVLILEC